MRGIPVLAFAAYSGVGKTALIERLVKSLKARGLRIAVIKHDGHDFEIDREGKDSWRFTRAGADISIISSGTKTALVEQGKRSLSQVTAMVRGVDLILVEGYKNEGLSQIGIRRRASGKGFTADISRYTAVVTDVDLDGAEVPCFGLDDIQELTDFIVENMDGFTRLGEPERSEGPAGCGRETRDRRGKEEAPSMDAWLKEAKADPSAAKVGMYLTHNGVVRETARAKARDGDETAGAVRGMWFSYDRQKVAAAVADAYKMEGVYYIRTWLNEGELKVGDDIMYILIGGDIRPHVVEALQYLVGRIKNECVTETEIMEPSSAQTE